MIDMESPIHDWFELTYAQYLTIPRSVLQSMPKEWQRRFVKCLEELDETIDWRPNEGCYWVRLKDAQGRFVHDPLMDYERGRRKLPLRTNSPSLTDCNIDARDGDEAESPAKAASFSLNPPKGISGKQEGQR